MFLRFLIGRFGAQLFHLPADLPGVVPQTHQRRKGAAAALLLAQGSGVLFFQQLPQDLPLVVVCKLLQRILNFILSNASVCKLLPYAAEAVMFEVDKVPGGALGVVQVVDQPGVLAKVAQLLSENKISISSLVQREGQSNNNVSLLIITHMTVERNIKRAIEAINRLPEVRDTVKLIRIEDI